MKPESSVFGARASVVTDEKPRCTNCHKVLAWQATRPWSIRCPRCHLDNSREASPRPA